jgi:hypothetical protein
MRSHMPEMKNFSLVPKIGGIQRSVFNRSHTHKTTFDVGNLVPILVDEILPGDTVDLKGQYFGRISSALKTPIMDNLHFDTFYFFVPNRLLWDNWEKFMGAQDEPGDSIDFEIPKIDASTNPFDGDHLYNYMGVPPGCREDVSALFGRAYNRIYIDWFRDQDIQTILPPIEKGDTDLETNYVMFNRNKKHDYFTSCRPWPQKGADVVLPLGTTAPVAGDGKALGLMNNGQFFGMTAYDSGTQRNLELSTNAYGANVGLTPTVGNNFTGANPTTIGVTSNGQVSGLFADLSFAEGNSINQLREAFAIQQLLEIDARGGTRYVEIIKNHFGVVSPDFRLDRAEYLGGGSQMININPVSQTSETGTTPQGNQTAYGVIGAKSGCSKSFTEHGILMVLANARPDLTYQQGIHKKFTRTTRYDYFLPSLAHLGEQAVLRKELFCSEVAQEDRDTVFGYQERWSEYRYFNSIISGKFNSDYPTGSLDAWHLSQDFGTPPVLNDSFIRQTDHDVMDRVKAVTTEPDLLLDCFFQYRHVRPMPVYSVPGLARL